MQYTKRFVLVVTYTCGLDMWTVCHEYTTVKKRDGLYPVWRCSTLERGDWTRQPTSGAPPLGVRGYACTAVGDALHFFGGRCNHDDCYHNSIHSLSTSSLHWVELSPTTSEGGAPMRKGYCGTVAFKDGEEDILYIVAGYGPTPSYHQPGAQYKAIVILVIVSYAMSSTCSH